MSAGKWETVRARGGILGPRHTVYHRRHISQRPHTWLTVQNAGAGSWVWRVYVADKVVDQGVRRSWSVARAAADAAFERYEVTR